MSPILYGSAAKRRISWSLETQWYTCTNIYIYIIVYIYIHIYIYYFSILSRCISTIYIHICMVLRPNHQSNRRFQRGGVDGGPVFSKHAWGIDLEISWDLFLLPSIKWLNPIPHLFWWKSGIPLSFGEIAGSSFQEEEQENAFTRDDESAVSSSSAIS